MSEIDEAMQILGASLNLADPTSTLSGALLPKQDIDEITAKIWANIHDDYRRLSDALLERSKPGPTHGVNTNRDDQFAGFASRLLQELLDQGAYVAISEWATGGDSLKSEQLIAQRAYDLVRHSIFCNGIHPDLWPGGTRDGQASDIYVREVDKSTDMIPDMPTWPEETSK